MAMCKRMMQKEKAQGRTIQMRKVWSLTWINFQRWKYDQRIWIILGFIAVLTINAVYPYAAYGLAAEKTCTAYFLPILFNSTHVSIGVMKTLLFLGCLFLLCDAPFIYRTTPYMIIRSRRECWWMGECLYILLATMFYLALITLVSMVTLLPVAVFDESWGSVFRDFSAADLEIMSQFTFDLNIPFETISMLYPSGAQLYTFFTVWAAFFLLGLLQYAINLATRSMFWGFAVAAVFVFLDPLLNVAAISPYFEWAQALSPVCWVTTNSLHLVDNGKYLAISYIVCMFILLIVLLLAVIRWLSKRVVIEVCGEV